MWQFSGCEPEHRVVAFVAFCLFSVFCVMFVAIAYGTALSTPTPGAVTNNYTYTTPQVKHGRH